MPDVIPPASAGVPRRSWRDLSWQARLGVLAVLTVLVLGVLELSARAYWCINKKVPLLRTERIWNTFFPEIEASKVAQVAPLHGDSSFDVLLLGPSVLQENFGDIGPRLQAALAGQLGLPVRVINLARMGMTSRDSYLKYRRLSDKRFDLVVFYDGINDVYLNACPRRRYRSDYTHCPRYEQLAMLETHCEHNILVFPYTLRYLSSMLLDKLNLSSRPRVQWHHHGSTIRTPKSFAQNYDEMLAIARERHEPVLLMTFAYYLDPNYTDAAFKARALDYANHVSPVALWGTPENVTRTMDQQNEVIRGLAAGNGDFFFVDQQKLMPSGKRYYHDICHFTEEGCARFVDNIVAHLDLDRVRIGSPFGKK